MTAKLAFARSKVIPLSDDEFERSGPTDQLSVYWIGHSLMQQTVQRSSGQVNLFTQIAQFADEQRLGYDMFDHTLFGAPLSLQWRGKPHSYARSAPEMAEKRAGMVARAPDFNSFVLTEVVPLETVFKFEFSAFYLQQYYQLIQKQNPGARVYLYEGWDYLHGSTSDIPPYEYDWRSRMEKQNALWEVLADTASQGLAVKPSLRNQLGHIFGQISVVQKKQNKIYSVPVGRVLIAIYDRLQNPRTKDDFQLATGERLAFYQLFANAYKNWPASWPLDQHHKPDNIDTVVSNLELADAEKALDDIHPSHIGIYVVALVHFATLYRRSPVGLSSIDELTIGAARAIQTIVWEVVLSCKRSGVSVS